MVRVYLVADGNEMCSFLFHTQHWECSKCMWNVLCPKYLLTRIMLLLVSFSSLSLSHSFTLNFPAHANAKNASLRSWILPVNSTCNSQLNMSAFLILTLFYPICSRGARSGRIPFVLHNILFQHFRCSPHFPVLFLLHSLTCSFNSHTFSVCELRLLPKAHIRSL